MALSNIRAEPRREIIESAIGILALLFILPFWALTAMWFQHYTGGPWDWNPNHSGAGCPWPLGLFLVPIGIFCLYVAIWGLLYVTHSLGEKVSAWLTKTGWDPRPKQRYRMERVFNPHKREYEKIRIAV